MKSEEERTRLKSLLKETITLLCKNGLGYGSSCSVEALIGITLDEHDIFLVNINETLSKVENQEPICTSSSRPSRKRYSADSALDFENTFTNDAKPAKRTKTHSLSMLDKKNIISAPEQTDTYSLQCPPRESVQYPSRENVFSLPSDIRREEIPGPLAQESGIVPLMRPPNEHHATVVNAFKNIQGIFPLPLFQNPMQVNPSNLSDSIRTNNPVQEEKVRLSHATNLVKDSLALLPPSPNLIKQETTPLSPPSESKPGKVQVCEHCCQEFKFAQSFRDHLRNRHGIGEPFICHCGKEIMDRRKFAQHKKACLVAISQVAEMNTSAISSLQDTEQSSSIDMCEKTTHPDDHLSNAEGMLPGQDTNSPHHTQSYNLHSTTAS